MLMLYTNLFICENMFMANINIQTCAKVFVRDIIESIVENNYLIEQ